MQLMKQDIMNNILAFAKNKLGINDAKELLETLAANLMVAYARDTVNGFDVMEDAEQSDALDTISNDLYSMSYRLVEDSNYEVELSRQVTETTKVRVMASSPIEAQQAAKTITPPDDDAWERINVSPPILGSAKPANS